MQSKIYKRSRPVALSLLVPVCLVFLVLLFLPSRRIEASQSVGSENCIACHEEQIKAFDDSIHGKKGFELRSEKACETCHGPGEEHVNSSGDPSKIRSFASLNAEEKSEPCLSCHDNGDRMYWSGSVHESRGLACQDCHSIHGTNPEEAQLTTASIPDPCFGCHKQKSSQFFRASHHPIREGKMTCSDCHNPHGSESPRLISNQTINDMCYECHAEKRGPFLWDHQPVREDCTICHDPHGTNHFKMVKTRVPYLCQKCHADGGHPSGLYDQSQIDSRRFFNRSCLNCHTTIHGSNNPSGHTFLR